MASVELFDSYRSLLFSIAYRMLGSVMDAEDIVQEAYLRWQQVSMEEVDAPKSFLAAIVTRLCIDHLRSAQVQREEYVGPWLPEPLVAERVPDIGDAVVLEESLSIAFMVLLEQLTPTQRAVFLLREVFEYEYSEIARIVGEREANCRQMVRRARQYLARRRPRFDPSPAQRERLTTQFLQTCTSGDMAGLLSLLADDITLWSDSGGKVPSALNPIYGADRVARLLLGLLRKAPPNLTLQQAWVNGQPGFVAWVDGQPISVLVLQVTDGRVQAIHVVQNPDKLQAVKNRSHPCKGAP